MTKLCVFTGSRADYGLLRPLISRIHQDPHFQLQLVVSGSHLSESDSLNEIKEDKFPIAAKIEMLLESNTSIGVTKSMGMGLMGYADILTQLKPDLVVILGDRFEAFSFAIATHVAQIPIAHLYGGEETQGAIDDAFRHSISKMAFLHFVSTLKYRQRVIQLGENPERVFHVGSLALDNLNTLSLLSKSNLESCLNLKFSKKIFLITMHPETQYKSGENPLSPISELLSALSQFKESSFIFTKANADPLGKQINTALETFTQKHPHSFLFDSLGTLKYFSLMNICDVVIGNSSSGLLEAPFFKKPSVNIGDRQKGRVFADSVLHCRSTKSEIFNAIQNAISDEFKQSCRYTHPYKKANTASEIFRILKETPIPNTPKSFYDISF